MSRPIMREWYSAAELAELGLPGLPATKQGVILVAKREGWAGREDAEGRPMVRTRQGRGGGVEYNASVLPDAALAKLMASHQVIESGGAIVDRESLWRRWETLPKTMRDEAMSRLSVVKEIEDLERLGLKKSAAIEQVAKTRKLLGEDVCASTLRDWLARIVGVDVSDRAAYLAPHYVGRTAKSECSQAALDFYFADFLRLSRPAHAACFRRLKREAALQGWTLPSAKTVIRRLNAEFPEVVQQLCRYGDQALAHAFPHLERSRAGIGALQIVNLDGHTWDNLVEWPDGEIGRPLSVAVQDIASGKCLAIRFDKTLNQHLVRLALSDVLGGYGVPETVLMDNGRENAAKSISGGQPTRWRWKVREEEAPGLLKTLGITAVFATPYWGQAKPIERMFRNFAGDLAKHPAFEGSYTGPNPSAKPANYGQRAIPIAEYEARIRAEIAAYNAEEGRTGAHMAGRSFDQVYEALAAKMPPRKATAAQLQMALLASEPCWMDRRDNSVRVADHRYWSPELARFKRQKVIVRFDPENLAKDVHVYSLEGRWLATAERKAIGTFDNRADAQAQGRARRAWVKTVKAERDARLKVNPADLAGEVTLPPPAPTPAEDKVIRPAFGAPRKADDFFDAWSRGVAG